MDSHTEQLLTRIHRLDEECSRLAVRWMEAMGEIDRLNTELDLADAELDRHRRAAEKATQHFVNVLRGRRETS